jgi:hypothetical protein
MDAADHFVWQSGAAMMSRRQKLAKKISDAFDGELLEDILPVLETIVAFAICSSYDSEHRVKAFQVFADCTLREISEMSEDMEEGLNGHVH